MGHASVANVLLSLSLKGAGGGAAAARAAAEVARSSVRTLLLPLLDRLIARLAAVLQRTWHIAVDHVAPQGTPSSTCCHLSALPISGYSFAVLVACWPIHSSIKAPLMWSHAGINLFPCWGRISLFLQG